MGKTQNYPLRAFTPSEEQELYRVAHATSERLDAVKRARALLSVRAGRPFTEAARETGYKSGDSISQLVERFNQRGLAAAHPTGCATSCPSQMKWFQIAHGCMYGFGVALLAGCQKTAGEERQVL